MKLKCLHCEHEFDGTVCWDNLGWHSMCPECECSFDVDVEDGKYYYDVVASICNETRRTDSHLICGGFYTEEEAMDYINEYDISEADYYKYCKNDETAYIEIERHDIDGSIWEVITVD